MNKFVHFKRWRIRMGENKTRLPSELDPNQPQPLLDESTARTLKSSV
ncbi:hypothetical protein MKY19_15800 [Paenibacillus sp. FSL R5-0744]